MGARSGRGGGEVGVRWGRGRGEVGATEVEVDVERAGGGWGGGDSVGESVQGTETPCCCCCCCFNTPMKGRKRRDDHYNYGKDNY